MAGQNHRVQSTGSGGADQRSKVVGILDLVEHQDRFRVQPQDVLELGVTKRLGQSRHALVRTRTRQATKLVGGGLAQNRSAAARQIDDSLQAGGVDAGHDPDFSN
jgi:hypothetical protein